MRLNCINLVSTEPERLRSFYAMILQKPYNEIVPGRSEDVDAQYRRLKQAGVAGCTEPVTYPWGWRAFGFCDPDGNHIDFVQQLDGGK